MAEIETPPITSEERLVPTRTSGKSMLERWVETDPKAAVERVEIMVRTLEQLRQASIKATYPSDWLIHTSSDGDGQIIKQVGYLQDSGGERAGKVWGIEVGNPAIEREDFPDGTYTYHMIAEAWSKVTGERLDYAEGSRWSGDGFFQRGGEKIDPTDVRKSAYANLHGRAVRALSGLNGVPLDMLRQAGLDVTKVVHINYGRGTKGGQSTGATLGEAGNVVVAFGNSKGKKPADLEDKDLAWYVKAYTENVADPGKAKFVKANQRVLDVLKAEQEGRAQSSAHEAETGTKAPDESSPRGKKIGDQWARLTEIGGVFANALLRQVTKDFGQERGGMSELTDDELAKLANTPDDILKKVAVAVKK